MRQVHPATGSRINSGADHLRELSRILTVAGSKDFDAGAQMVRNVAVQGDHAVAIEGSGDSRNIINTAGYTKRKRAEQSIWTPVDDMRLCEDVHAISGHIVMKALVS
jgi:hypothetical protein